MWCGTGKTRTFTMDIFIQGEPINVVVFPSLGLINQYCNDYILSLEEPFQSEFKKYKGLAFCSDNDGKLKSKETIIFTSNEKTLMKFIHCKHKKIIAVTYQSFEKFVDICIKLNLKINNLIYDEAHHIIGDKIQQIVFQNDYLNKIVDKTAQTGSHKPPRQSALSELHKQ
jgi:superfamily II DNA or RNA helicase